MHSVKPPTITHSTRGLAAGKWPQRSFAPSGAAKLPQTKPCGSRNRAGSLGSPAVSSTGGLDLDLRVSPGGASTRSVRGINSPEHVTALPIPLVTEINVPHPPSLG